MCTINVPPEGDVGGEETQNLNDTQNRQDPSSVAAEQRNLIYSFAKLQRDFLDKSSDVSEAKTAEFPASHC